ncbi:hypothetical protein [Kitasatospora sp. NPDC057223]|uniref:hypothetical protein n=1 Tax=Kitasatospora sp. NPDC057223 TaxID=3346055 RepID=UPI003637234B
MAQSTGAPSSNASIAMPAPSPRIWDGFDDPTGPAAWNAFGRQPSRPTPPFGAPNIGQRTINPKENPMGYAGNYNEPKPLAELVIVPQPTTEQPPAEPQPDSE